MPPGYYAIAQLGRMLPGDPLVTLRLPSIVGYLMTLLGAYWFVRKSFPVSAAFAAVVLITLSPFREYALEARSYTLVVGFLAASAACWQRIDRQRFMTVLFALFLTLSVSCHHLAVVAVLSFGAAELASTFLSRRIRWGVWAGCLLATSPFFITLPCLIHYRELFGKNFWAQPSWSMVRLTYGDYFGLDPKLAFVLILLFVLVVCELFLRMKRQPQRGMREGDFTLPEIVLVSGFLFYPALLVVLTKLLGSGYTPRYGWPGILGLVFGSMYLIKAIWLEPASTYLIAALLAALVVQDSNDFLMLNSTGGSRADLRWTRLAELSRSEPPDMPVVIGNPAAYLEAAEYAPAEVHNQLVMVVDADIATRLVGSDTPDKTNRLLAKFISLRIEDLVGFQAAHQKFILYSGADWVIQYLIERKYRLRLLANDETGGATYIAER